MKKLCFLLLCVVFVSVSYSQQVRLGIEAGLNLSNMTISPFPTDVSKSAIGGARVGMLIDVPLGSSFFIQTGLFYNRLGTKISGSNLNYSPPVTETETLLLNYVHIPFVIIYKIPAGQGYIFCGAGFYYGLGTSGQVKLSQSQGNFHYDSSFHINFGSSPTDDFKNADLGIVGNAGYEMRNGFLLRLGFDVGVSNISNSQGLTEKNACFHFSAGYLFGNRRAKRSVKPQWRR